MGALAAGRTPAANAHRSRVACRAFLSRVAGEDGSVLLETALVLPFYFLILFGLISFAMIFFGYCSATYAAKAAVRYAAVHSSTSILPCTSSTIQSIVTANLWAVPAGTSPAITSTWTPQSNGGGGPIGSIVSVTIKITYGTNMPFVSLPSFTGTASSQGYVIF